MLLDQMTSIIVILTPQMAYDWATYITRPVTMQVNLTFANCNVTWVEVIEIFKF